MKRCSWEDFVLVGPEKPARDSIASGGKSITGIHDPAGNGNFFGGCGGICVDYQSPPKDRY